MFTFIHTYTDESWDGLLKNGLFRRGDGLKIMHTSYAPEKHFFHNIAKIGGPLESRLRECRCPFYIDRLQGGIALPRWYRYDQAQLSHYRAMLGDNFWGWQMHEWSSNYRSDYHRILDMYQKLRNPNPTPHERQELWNSVRRGDTKIFLEALTPEEWSGHREPVSREMFLDDANWLYMMRSLMTDGQLIPADSYHMAPRIEIANGAKLLLPEVGWQIPNMRMQMAYTRGMARSAGIRFGIYYECWGHNSTVNGITIPFSLRDGEDEWGEDQLHTGAGAQFSAEIREKGGSSRNLQERAWRYAYLSGATVLGEEYGVCNTFRDYHTFDLSPYGQVKKDFLTFTERFPDIGTPFTPFVIVLPKEMPIFDVALRDNYLDYDGDDTSYPISNTLTRRVREGLNALFGEDGSGNHAHVIKKGGMPDVFDIVHADQEDAIARYDYIIDLSGDATFAKAHSNIAAPQDIEAILKTLLPIHIGGGIHTIFNRTGDGWLVLAMNNDGIVSDNFQGDQKLPDAAVTAQIQYHKPDTTCNVLDGTGTMMHTETGDMLCLQAGEWVLLGVQRK